MIISRLFFYKKLLNLEFIKFKIKNNLTASFLFLGNRYNLFNILCLKQVVLFLNYILLILFVSINLKKSILFISINFLKINFKILNFFFNSINTYILFKWCYGLLGNTDLLLKNKALKKIQTKIKTPDIFFVFYIRKNMQLNEISKLNIPIFSFILDFFAKNIDYPIPLTADFKNIYFFIKLLNNFLNR
jgi:hypothetical protein